MQTRIFRRVDLRVILLGMVTALFDATIYIFVIEWTPALQQADRWVIYEPLPLGLIFSCYMVVSFSLDSLCRGSLVRYRRSACSVR